MNSKRGLTFLRKCEEVALKVELQCRIRGFEMSSSDVEGSTFDRSSG